MSVDFLVVFLEKNEHQQYLPFKTVPVRKVKN